MRAWQCCGTVLPVSFAKTAFARGCGDLEEVGARVVFFEYRVRIACGKQAAADVRVRTDQQDASGRVADDLQPLVSVLGEMAVDLPAFVLGVHVSDDLFLLF